MGLKDNTYSTNNLEVGYKRLGEYINTIATVTLGKEA